MHNEPACLQTTSLFKKSSIIPVLVIEDLDTVLPLARALQAGGVHLLEITLRTPLALAAIRKIRQTIPELIVGAGTITTREQLRQSIEAGAQFLISPGTTSDLLQAGKQSEVPFIPGIATISEVMMGFALGYQHFKFFPAEAAGGVKWLESIYGPFPQLSFFPTGGINANNFLDYLALPNVSCIGGSWIVPKSAIIHGDWQMITTSCKNATTLALEHAELKK